MKVLPLCEESKSQSLKLIIKPIYQQRQLIMHHCYGYSVRQSFLFPFHLHLVSLLSSVRPLGNGLLHLHSFPLANPLTMYLVMLKEERSWPS